MFSVVLYVMCYLLIDFTFSPISKSESDIYLSAPPTNSDLYTDCDAYFINWCFNKFTPLLCRLHIGVDIL